MTESLSETPVEIYPIVPDLSSELGGMVTPLVVPDIDPETVAFNDNLCSCEDCPETNDNPPEQSDCPNFEHLQGQWPVCSRDDTGNAAIRRYFFEDN